MAVKNQHVTLQIEIKRIDMAEMMRLSADDVLKRHDKALTKKEDFRSLYEEC